MDTAGAEEAVKETLEPVVAGANDSLENLARWGLAARGLVYGLIGVFALLTAFKQEPHVIDQREAIAFLSPNWPGRLLVGAIGVALLGNAIWRFLHALYVSGERKSMRRAKHILSGAGYVGIAAIAFQTAYSGGPGRGNSVATIGTYLLLHPAGRLLVGVIGVAIAVGGLVQIVSCYKGTYWEGVKEYAMANAGSARACRAAGGFGTGSLGVLLALMGAFLIASALEDDPEKLHTFGGVLNQVHGGPFGTALLAVLGAGLIAYAVFLFALARYRRMKPIEASKDPATG